MADVKRKDAQRMAVQLVDAIERLRSDMAMQDATIQRQAAEIERLRADKARYAEIVRIKDDLITEMQRRLIADDPKVPKPKEPTL